MRDRTQWNLFQSKFASHRRRSRVSGLPRDWQAVTVVPIAQMLPVQKTAETKPFECGVLDPPFAM